MERKTRKVEVVESTSKPRSLLSRWFGAGGDCFDYASEHPFFVCFSQKADEQGVVARMGKTLVFHSVSRETEVPQHSECVEGRFIRPLEGRWIRFYVADRGCGRSGDSGTASHTLYLLVSDEGKVQIEEAEDDHWRRHTSAAVTVRVSGVKSGNLVCDIVAYSRRKGKTEQLEGIERDIESLKVTFGGEVRDLCGFFKPRREKLTLRDIAEKYKLYVANRGVTASNLAPSYLIVYEGEGKGPQVIETLPTYQGAVIFLRRMTEEFGRREPAEGRGVTFRAALDFARASREKALAERFGSS